MIHILLLDLKGRSLYSNLPTQCTACAQGCTSESEVTNKCGIPEQRRRGRMASDLGTAFLCTEDPDAVASSKVFKRQLRFYFDQIPTLEMIRFETREASRKDGKRLAHNLQSLSAHLLQEIFSIVPQERVTEARDATRQKEVIREVLLRASDDSALALLRAVKNAKAMTTEISVFDKLYNPTPLQVNRRSHKMHKVVLNSLSMFFLDFQERGVKVSLGPTTQSLDIDYQLFSIALYHLIHNAAKYGQANSLFQISFESSANRLAIRFSMTSYVVRADEVQKIFDDGYSGQVPTKAKKAGSGIGMGIAKRIIELHGGRVTFVPGPTLAGDFAANQLVIELPINYREPIE